jgi:predicted nucleic acid-binding protein
MKILLDSDFLFALFVSNDFHHQKAKKLLEKYLNEEIYVLNLVIQETATVLSYRFDQKVAVNFLEKIKTTPVLVINLDDKLEEKVWVVFKNQKKKGISFIDCANLALLATSQMEKILSFDKFYPKKFRLI